MLPTRPMKILIIGGMGCRLTRSIVAALMQAKAEHLVHVECRGFTTPTGIEVSKEQINDLLRIITPPPDVSGALKSLSLTLQRSYDAPDVEMLVITASRDHPKPIAKQFRKPRAKEPFWKGLPQYQINNQRNQRAPKARTSQRK